MQIKSNIKICSKVQSKQNEYLPVLATYDGIENEQTVVKVDNTNKTIEVVLKPHSYASIFDFPNIGDSATIYIDESKNTLYRWSESTLKYYCVGSDYNEIKIIDGGNANGNIKQ